MEKPNQQGKNDISKWCHDIIKGPAGFESYEYHEFVIWHIPRECAVAEWVIRCLANPSNKGSEMVLNSIMNHRNGTIKKDSLIEMAFAAGRSKTSWEQFKKDHNLP